MGRPPIGRKAMTGAERIRRYREKHAVTKQSAAEAEMAERLDEKTKDEYERRIRGLLTQIRNLKAKVDV
jgi:hypothetical protein